MKTVYTLLHQNVIAWYNMFYLIITLRLSMHVTSNFLLKLFMLISFWVWMNPLHISLASWSTSGLRYSLASWVLKHRVFVMASLAYKCLLRLLPLPRAIQTCSEYKGDSIIHYGRTHEPWNQAELCEFGSNSDSSSLYVKCGH